MKFTYQYRTSDNVVRFGTIKAASKDSAYSALKSSGIRPIRVDVSPGFFNRLFGSGKRWLAICLLAAVAMAAIVYAVIEREQVRDVIDGFSDGTRRQVLGDPAVIEKGVRTGWKDVFADEGERFLACFALPGQPPAKVDVDANELMLAIGRKVAATSEDSLEAKQLKAIVEGMKDEARAYLADGGSLKKYRNRLIRRQQDEIGYYKRAEREIESAKNGKVPTRELEALWEKRNAELRMMGIRHVPMPEGI